MTNPSDSSDRKATCVARRHLEASLYVTYDAMLATAKAGRKKRIAEGKPQGDLIFSGTMANLANKTNRSRRTETESVKKLVEKEWAIPLQNTEEEQRRNKRAGTWAPYEYRIIEHDEFVKNHSCPPFRYSEDGSLTKPGKLPLNLLRVNLLRLLGEDWAKEHGANVDSLSAGEIHALNSVHLDMLPEGERLCAVQVPDEGTVTELPRTVTVCGTPRTATVSEAPCAETPSPTVCGAPRTTVTEPPHTTVTESPRTRFASLPAKEACLPSFLPSAVDGFFHKYLSTIGTPAKKHKQAFIELAANHDIEILDKALAAIVADGFGDDVQSKWGVTIHRLPEKVAVCEQKRAEEIEHKKQEVRIEESIKRQQAADHERWNHEPEPQNEASIEDLM